jgi:tetratricopeptide (TPR) repeat protein
MKNIRFLLILIVVPILFSCHDENSLLGDAYYESGKYHEAIEAYDEFLKLKPRHVKTIYNRGRCYQELGEYEKAMADF